MKALKIVSSIFERCTSDMSSLPPTALYNEGWMLRLVLEWFSQHPTPGHPLDFTNGSRWYSEALIPSAFLPRMRGDKFAESWTHADGVIGHFEIGKNRDTDLTLLSNATILKVLEAKMFSRLSKGTKNAPYFNQAARNIACIAEIMNRRQKDPKDMVSLSFYVIAPKSQIDRGLFAAELSRESIEEIVKKRVNDHDAEHKTHKIKWFQDWFMPTLGKAEIKSLSWEEVLSYLNEIDPDIGKELILFYQNCLQFNRFRQTDQ